ncbi:hypothetical protein XENTR_v10023262 [Xenopus tropicalis]|uniref:E3 ubiquitin/ISG15 ligase TRIM25 n=1 Tax=Xenopus tropicalis TaxID=8364 RepID=A0A8J1IWK1_XENTR|nr:E3 ubiquitin/ISG15 ligase TRIM25 [Xenopus tropicalis]KAE8578002.1 hypothetical protein XENTR_v10023262 [Xenopus tropicalis]
MAAADLRDELSCSICLSVYTDPVSLPCSHNFCRGCIGRVLGTQEGSGGYSCPECRAEYRERPALPRNRILGNIAERFLSAQPEPGETGILCTYCDSPVAAVKSCEQCETSLCDTHLHKHNKSVRHVLTEPTISFMGKKCSTHRKILEYYCPEDSACVCVSCCLAGGHRGHRVELLSEASEKKKEKLRKVLEKLSPEREETERGAQRLQERRRDVAERAAGETERVTALFRDIREELEALEKRLLSNISRQKEELSLQLTELIQQLEIKKDELSGKIRHIEKLCNMADPLTVLQEQLESDGAADNEEEYDTEEDKDEEYDTEEADTEGRETEGIKDPAAGDLDVGRISETLLTGLAGIVTGVKGRVYGQEATDLVLDINTAYERVALSEDRKTASRLIIACRYPHTPERFIKYPQVLSSRGFPSGRHYWEVEGSESGKWAVGAAYPSIEREGDKSGFGITIKSWCLCKYHDKIIMAHNSRTTPVFSSCRRFRISLDYEAGHLSFYELSEPIRHLHTFTASFTEPLHPAFGVYEKGWVRICS